MMFIPPLQAGKHQVNRNISLQVLGVLKIPHLQNTDLFTTSPGQTDSLCVSHSAPKNLPHDSASLFSSFDLKKELTERRMAPSPLVTGFDIPKKCIQESLAAKM